MSTRNWNRGGIGLAVAALAAMSVTACDPYLKGNTDAPVVLGVTMVDLNYNTWFSGILPPDTSDQECTAPYAQPDQAWADANFPGLCVEGGPTTVCPVLCFPSRTGPGYAPFYQGNLGGTYKKADGLNYTYTVLSAYSLSDVPPAYRDVDDNTFWYSQILVLFNKTMDPATIQPDPNVARPPSTLTVTLDGVDVTEDFAFEYNPDSDTTYWGASMLVTADFLFEDSTYRIVGTVKDQQGNSLAIDVTVNTGLVIDEGPAALRKPIALRKT